MDIPKISKQPAKFWGERLIKFKSVESTNDIARKMASLGEGNGTVILAGEQTGGKGRRDRAWFSPPGGLWFTVILRPDLPPVSLSGITLLFSLFIIEFLNKELEKSGVNTPLQLYWPNDIYFSEKKLGGILIESRCSDSSVKWLIAGIGININNEEKNFPSLLNAVSLNSITKRRFAIRSLLKRMLVSLENGYNGFIENGFSKFISKISDICPMINRVIEITDPDGLKTIYKTLGIGESGQLIVLDSAGQKKEIITAERTKLIYEKLMQ